MHDAVLDKAKKISGSDRQTAMRIGLQAQFIYDVRRGDKTLPAECIVKLAFLIGEPWPRLLAEMEGAQAKTVQKKDLWLRVASGALSLSIAILLATYAQPAISDIKPSQVMLNANNDGLFDGLSIMRRFKFSMRRRNHRRRKHRRSIGSERNSHHAQCGKILTRDPAGPFPQIQSNSGFPKGK